MLEMRTTEFPIMKFLISHAKQDLRITQAALLPKEDDEEPNADSVRCLLHHDPDFLITEESAVALLTAENGIEMLDILLGHSLNMDITPPMFLAFFRGRSPCTDTKSARDLMNVFWKHHKLLRYTNEMLELVGDAFPNRSDAAVRELFYGLEEVPWRTSP